VLIVTPRAVSFRAVRRSASRRTALSVTGSFAPVEDPNFDGITNPRIADASVVPSGTLGNTNAAVLAIAERAASPLLATTSRRVGRAFSSTVGGRRACRSSRGPCGDSRNNPCRRQADQVVAPSSTGRRLLVEDDHWRLRQDADIEQPERVAAGVGRPSSSHSARMPGWTSRWGRGSLGHAQDDRESAVAAGLRSLSPAVAASPLARTARSLVDDEQEPSVGSADHRRRRERAAPHGAPPGDAGNNPCRRQAMRANAVTALLAGRV
jgi:hypothetical protein